MRDFSFETIFQFSSCLRKKKKNALTVYILPVFHLIMHIDIYPGISAPDLLLLSSQLSTCPFPKFWVFLLPSVHFIFFVSSYLLIFQIKFRNEDKSCKVQWKKFSGKTSVWFVGEKITLILSFCLQNKMTTKPTESMDTNTYVHIHMDTYTPRATQNTQRLHYHNNLSLRCPERCFLWKFILYFISWKCSQVDQFNSHYFPFNMNK